MPELMWTVWIVGTVLSLVTIYVLLRVLYPADEPVDRDQNRSRP
jgi:hypothetical protein